jgi:KipI family sensor histidine kinase inhibitor
VADTPSIEAASDRSLLITFRGNPGAHELVRRLFLSLRAAPGVVNLHPAYASLLVDFDPLQADVPALADEIMRGLEAPETAPEPRHAVEIPVCYGGELGPDLEVVAAHCGFTPRGVIERHAAPEYLVAFLGFSPGFPYLSGLDPALATSRLASPRTHVAAGSVAIGGAQAGVYPTESPGGWQIIGRTPLRLFDPRREAPALVEMGDAVRFRPVSREEFEAWPGCA